MIAQKFNEFAVELINAFGADIFSPDKLQEVFIEFHDLPDNYALQIRGWAFSMFSLAKNNPCTPDWLIRQARRAKEHGKSQTLKKNSEPRHESEGAPERSMSDLGFSTREEFYKWLSTGIRSTT